MQNRLLPLPALTTLLPAQVLRAQDQAGSYPVAVTYYRVHDGHMAESASNLGEKGKPVYEKMVEMGVWRSSSMYQQ